MIKSLDDLFRWHANPSAPLCEAVQNAARRAGWIAPWDQRGRCQQHNRQKTLAGENSGRRRSFLAAQRCWYVGRAFSQLKPAHRFQPYSDESLDALSQLLRDMLAKDRRDPDSAILAKPHRVVRETLKKDMKSLGIRSKRQAQRSRYRTPFQTKTSAN